MVDHPLTFTYPQLLAMPLFEQYVTLACVSNTVGGNLVGNTLWTGVHLKEVLAQAGVQSGATQIVGRSVDGFTVGFPTDYALDPAREPMIVVGMNRQPLPAEHGYPARLIVPGLFGYVSATKWLSEIELTTREAFDGYWVPLGWAKDGPIVTESRIDHPSDGAQLSTGNIDIDGVAWAPDRGDPTRGSADRQRALAGRASEPRDLQGHMGPVVASLAGDAGFARHPGTERPTGPAPCRPRRSAVPLRPARPATRRCR
jgi:DMSO/TMAO reductase YedYZ molybdopterin-dependent catalytic subunit